MLSKTVIYEDFAGNKVTETLQFNLTKTEALEIAYSLPQDVKDSVGADPNAIDEETAVKLIGELGDANIFAFIKEIVGKAYGVKSEDNKHFKKTPEMRADFEQSAAYDAIIMELMTSDEEAASNFINAVLPAGLPNSLPANNK